MIPLTITPDIDRDPWADLIADPKLLNTDGRMATVERVGLLRHGTVEGNATVSIAVRLHDGRVVLAETTVALARAAVTALGASPVIAEEVIGP